MKKILSKILITVIVLTSLIVPITNVQAANTGTVVSVQNIKTRYATDDKRFVINRLSGYSDNTTDYAYAIDDNTVQSLNHTQTISTSNTWSSFTAKQKELIGIITVVGAPNYTYVNLNNDTIATQSIIQEIYKGWRTDFVVDKIKNKTFYNVIMNDENLKKAYEGILNRASNYDKTPSFNGKSYIIPYNVSSKKNIIELTDDNNILKDFTAHSDRNDVAAKISDNKLIIESTKRGLSGTITLYKKGTVGLSQVHGNVVSIVAWPLTNMKSRRQYIFGTYVPRHVTSTVNYVIAKDGTLIINSSFPNGEKVENVSYKISNEELSYNKTLASNNAAVVSTDDLIAYYEYTITPVLPENVEVANFSQTLSNYSGTNEVNNIKFKPGGASNSAISFTYRHFVCNLEMDVVDFDTGEALPNFKFELINSAHTYKFTTNNYGKISASNIVPGTYTLKNTVADSEHERLYNQKVVLSRDTKSYIRTKKVGNPIYIYKKGTAPYDTSFENYTPVVKKTSINNAKVTGIKAKTYNGKNIGQSPIVKIGSKTLKNGTDYYLAYKNNKAVGTATVSIIAKGNYTGRIVKTFTIKPKSTSIKKITSGKKSLNVTWKKPSNITGYQIQVATNSKFTKNKKSITVSKAKTTSKKITKLKAKKKNYVRIRTYKTVNKKKIYSSWSKVKTVTVK